MEVKKAGASLDSVISGFNRRIAELQDLVIARNTYPASSVTDLSAVDAAVKAMELQVQAIKDRLRDETLAIPKAKLTPFSPSLSQKLIDAAVKQQKKLQDLSIYVPSHIHERMSMLGLDTNDEGSQQNTGFGSLEIEEVPAALPKEKKGRSTPPLWFITAEELDSLSGYMRGRLTVEKINAAINDMATYAEANSQLISAPNKRVAGDSWEKALELRDIAMTEAVKGKHFFLETDMKGPALMLDNIETSKMGRKQIENTRPKMPNAETKYHKHRED
ncbi:spindle and kinetochore-associated protein 1 homolog [Prunus yedoensis var. nudiflora]|uniref:Spindle and kinetochore-associated protein 1 homolog n=1 Tax=Prunus yedoensis var. nudiflora TaxID=2094558 RepID=A0A314UUS0_PRUYE|nr:spindle and kinetochore-associated protein 1 homolog [Prunus yedoensis var. nudiflora]